MSWLEHIEVTMQPSSLTLRRARAFSAGGAARVVPLAARAAEGAEAWSEPLQALARALDSGRDAHSALHVVLSDHFARFAVVPWSADLVGDAERAAFARLSFSQIYGPISDGWEMALDERLATKPAIAAAIDRGLLQALRELCTARRMRLASVVPAFVRDLNRHRAAMRGSEFWLARVEPGRLTLALRRERAWVAVRTRRLDAAPAAALPGALRQEALACGAAPHGTVCLIDSTGTVQTIPGWQTVRVGRSARAASAPSARTAAAK